MTRSRFLTLAGALFAAPFAARAAAASPAPSPVTTRVAETQYATIEYTLKPADGVGEELERMVRDVVAEELSKQCRPGGSLFHRSL